MKNTFIILFLFIKVSCICLVGFCFLLRSKKKKAFSIKSYLLSLCVQHGRVNSEHFVVQQISRTFLSCKIETLYLFNKHAFFLAPFALAELIISGIQFVHCKQVSSGIQTLAQYHLGKLLAQLAHSLSLVESGC